MLQKYVAEMITWTGQMFGLVASGSKILNKKA